jgi:hypothetical protein
MRGYSGEIVSFTCPFFSAEEEMLTMSSGNGREVPTCWVYE